METGPLFSAPSWMGIVLQFRLGLGNKDSAPHHPRRLFELATATSDAKALAVDTQGHEASFKSTSEGPLAVDTNDNTTGKV
jgi:hypothetical protein